MHGKRTACFFACCGRPRYSQPSLQNGPSDAAQEAVALVATRTAGCGQKLHAAESARAPDGRSWLYPRGGVPIHSPTRNYGSTIRRRDVAHFTGTGQEAASRGRRETRAPDPYYSAPSLVGHRRSKHAVGAFLGRSRMQIASSSSQAKLRPSVGSRRGVWRHQYYPGRRLPPTRPARQRRGVVHAAV